MMDRVLVQRVEKVRTRSQIVYLQVVFQLQVSKTAGGILLPESVQSKINEGTVIAVGPGGRTRDGATVPIVRSLDTRASRITLTEFVYAEC